MTEFEDNLDNKVSKILFQKLGSRASLTKT